jgi:NTE family protein
VQTDKHDVKYVQIIIRGVSSLGLKERKIGLALSGGGFRAAVFHLGILKWLAEKRLLESISNISSVSGASIAIGLIYSMNNNKWPTSTEYIEDVLPKVKVIMTSRSLQFDAISRLIRKLWLLNKRANVIAEAIMKDWGVSGTLSQLPKYPLWKISTTTYETGKNWRISQEKMGDYKFGYTCEPDVPLAVAMAASAGYPAVIGPYALKTSKYKWFKYDHNGELTISVDPQSKIVHLWDGGVYENLGAEAFFKSDKLHKDIDYLLVSDASSSVKVQPRSRLLHHKNLKRLITIAIDQARSVRTRQMMSYLINNPHQGLYLLIGNTAEYILGKRKVVHSSAEEIIRASLTKEDVKKVKNFGTDIKKLTVDKFDLILRHGYEVMNCTYEAHENI